MNKQRKRIKRQWESRAPHLNSRNRYQALDIDELTDSTIVMEQVLGSESEGSTGLNPNMAWQDSKTVLNSSKRNKKKEIKLKVELHKTNTHEVILAKALLDCGVTGLFMDKDFATKQGFML